MTLLDLQRDFRRWLASGSETAARRIPGAHEAGLAVYQNNYRAQLVGCLEASYPLLRTRMGEDAFLHRRSSTSTCIRRTPGPWTPTPTISRRRWKSCSRQPGPARTGLDRARSGHRLRRRGREVDSPPPTWRESTRHSLNSCLASSASIIAHSDLAFKQNMYLPCIFCADSLKSFKGSGIPKPTGPGF